MAALSLLVAASPWTAVWAERSIVRPPGTVAVLTLSDALDPKLIEAFQRKTGLRVLVDFEASPDGLAGALRTAKPGYDLALLPLDAFHNAVRAGSLGVLGAGNLPDIQQIDPALIKAVATQDVGGTHAVPFDWYPVGLAVNAAKLKGVDLSVDASNGWDVLLKPETLRRAASCGFGVPDKPQLLYAMAMQAIGSAGVKANALERRQGFAILTQMRLAAKKEPEVGLIEGMAQGSLCVALLAAPDAALAAERAHAAGNGAMVSFVLPANRGILSADVLAIPANAANPEGARLLLRFLLEPENAARAARFGFVMPALGHLDPGPPSGAFNDATVLPNLALPDDDPNLGRTVDAEWRRGAAR